MLDEVAVDLRIDLGDHALGVDFDPREGEFLLGVGHERSGNEVCLCRRNIERACPSILISIGGAVNPDRSRLSRRLCRFLAGLALGSRWRNAKAAGGHLAGAVHAQFVHHAGAGTQVGGQTFGQARDVEEDVAAAVIGAQKTKALSFEVGDYGAGLLAGRRFARWRRRPGAAAWAGGSILSPTPCLIRAKIGFGPVGGRLVFRRAF